METPLAARDQWIELAKTDRLRGLLKRVAPRIVRIYTLRGFESVLAGSVQVSTGTKTSLSFQDGPVFTRVHRRAGPAAPSVRKGSLLDVSLGPFVRGGETGPAQRSTAENTEPDLDLVEPGV